MRKLLIIMLIFLKVSTNTITFEPSRELFDLIHFAEKESLSIEQWEVILLEKKTYEEAEHLLKELKKIKDVQIISKTEHIIKYSIPMSTSNNHIKQSMTMVFPKNNQYSPEITIKLKGKNWNEEILREYRQIFDEEIPIYFTKNAQLFTCLVVTSNDIMSDVYFTDILKNNFEIENIVVQSDTLKQSTYDKILYGYNPSWDNDISLLHQRLNMQIVMQHHKNLKTKVIIGTPILMNEY